MMVVGLRHVKPVLEFLVRQCHRVAPSPLRWGAERWDPSGTRGSWPRRLPNLPQRASMAWVGPASLPCPVAGE